MKRSELRQIIKEEIQKLNESSAVDDAITPLEKKVLRNLHITGSKAGDIFNYMKANASNTKLGKAIGNMNKKEQHQLLMDLVNKAIKTSVETQYPNTHHIL